LAIDLTADRGLPIHFTDIVSQGLAGGDYTITGASYPATLFLHFPVPNLVDYDGGPLETSVEPTPNHGNPGEAVGLGTATASELRNFVFPPIPEMEDFLVPPIALTSSSGTPTTAAVPELSTWAMMLLGLAGLGCAQRAAGGRRRRGPSRRDRGAEGARGPA
jgi:hypothetical protein